MTEPQKIKIQGKIWKFDDNIDTDIIIATQYLISDISKMKTHAFEVIDKEFAEKVSVGDIIVAGKNFGCGSSRQQAVDVLKALGIGAVIAKSFARIFYRNSINLGLPLIELDSVDKLDGKQPVGIEINPDMIRIVSGSDEFVVDPFPEFIMNILTIHRVE